MSLLILLGQIALGLPFIVFAYWYQCQEAIYRGILRDPTEANVMFLHAAFGIFFSVSFSILAMLLFPPGTKVITLLSSLFILARALDVIEEGWSKTPFKIKWNVFRQRFLSGP